MLLLPLPPPAPGGLLLLGLEPAGHDLAHGHHDCQWRYLRGPAWPLDREGRAQGLHAHWSPGLWVWPGPVRCGGGAAQSATGLQVAHLVGEVANPWCPVVMCSVVWAMAAPTPLLSRSYFIYLSLCLSMKTRLSQTLPDSPRLSQTLSDSPRLSQTRLLWFSVNDSSPRQCWTGSQTMLDCFPYNDSSPRQCWTGSQTMTPSPDNAGLVPRQ